MTTPALYEIREAADNLRSLQNLADAKRLRIYKMIRTAAKSESPPTKTALAEASGLSRQTVVKICR